jgi:hypothetical protein
MDQDRVKAGIAEHNLQPASRRRICPKNRVDLLFNALPHLSPPLSPIAIDSPLMPGANSRSQASSCILFYVRFSLTLLAFLGLVACSSPPPPTKAVAADPNGPGPAAAIAKHPLAKYLEFAGFRLSEASPNKLKIMYVAINHSEADLGELVAKIKIVTSNAKPEDPPIAEFEAKIPALGPHEVKNLEASAPTKLRLYELPDWQFLRAQFEITSPPPQE